MKKFRDLPKLSLAILGLLLAGSAAKADTLTLTLDSPFQSGPSGPFVFTGTIAYTNADSVSDGGATEYLNADSVSVDAPATLDDGGFLNNAPLSMNPGDSWSGTIFTVTTPPFNSGSLAENLYTGSFGIVGGDSSTDDTDLLAKVDFDVQVTPEPPTWELVAIALISLLGFVKWNSWRHHSAF